MNATFYNLKTIEEKIAYLKNNELELPNIDKYNSEWDEKRHRIMTDLSILHLSLFNKTHLTRIYKMCQQVILNHT